MLNAFHSFYRRLALCGVRTVCVFFIFALDPGDHYSGLVVQEESLEMFLCIQRDLFND